MILDLLLGIILIAIFTLIWKLLTARTNKPLPSKNSGKYTQSGFYDYRKGQYSK